MMAINKQTLIPLIIAIFFGSSSVWWWEDIKCSFTECEKIYEVEEVSCGGKPIEWVTGCRNNETFGGACPKKWEQSKLNVVVKDGKGKDAQGNGTIEWIDKNDKNNCSARVHIGVSANKTERTAIGTSYIKYKCWFC